MGGRGAKIYEIMNNEAQKQHSEIIIYFRSSDKGNEKCQVTPITKARLRLFFMKIRERPSESLDALGRFCKVPEDLSMRFLTPTPYAVEY